MRRRRLGRLGIFGGVTGAAVALALTLAGQSTAQYPYPSYPTTPSSSPSSSPGPTQASSSSKKKKKHVTITGTTTSTYSFAPKTVRIKKGQTVSWSWMSNALHNVTFSSLGKHSSTSDSGSFKLTFKKKGTFNYECTVHFFKGKVIVK